MLKRYIEQGLIENKILPDILRDAAAKYPGKTALVDFEKRITYEELWQDALRLSGIFQREGIGKGERVVLWMNNRIEFFGVFFGILLIGACPVLLLPTHRERELQVITEFTDAKAIVTYGTELGYDYLAAAVKINQTYNEKRKIFAFCNGESVINLKEYQTENCDVELPAIDGNDVALYLLSGGTTGIPKVIPKRHAAYVYNAMCSAKRCGTEESSVYLAVLSIAHDYPLSCPGVLGCMLQGGTSVLSMTASFDEVMMYVKEEQVTYTQLAPAIAALWLECMEWEEDCDFSSMKYILIGASKLEWELAEQIEETFQVKILQGYGLGEGITCFTSVNDNKETAWTTQGTPVSEYDEIKIVDENGAEVLAGVAGELTERGPYTFDGYYNAPEINEQVFTGDGFFHTGDKALLTPEGRVKILGRVKEQINRAGENVIPGEIEQFLKEHPGIKDASVFGMPDEELGEKICAVLIGKGVEVPFPELCSYLSKQGLAAFKLPDCIYYVEKFPLINVGKVDKKKLKEQILNL